MGNEIKFLKKILRSILVKEENIFYESVDRERVLKVLPLGQKKIEVRKGGLLGKTLCLPELGDQTDELVVANAIVTVYVP